ncbi:MAG: hypothetical protein JW894_04780 [Bacteroidales bacterium]|nr:hypothetical protein [Bacteroidales bacterium]
MKKLLLTGLGFITLILVFSTCKKDDENGEEQPPYVGTWETAVFGEAPPQQIVFTFTPSAFTAEVFFVIASNLSEFMGIKGDIDEIDEQTLDVSLTDLGLWDVGLNNYNWQNRTDNPTEFSSIHETYLSGSIPLDFEATYEVEGDDLTLIIDEEEVQDTIYLYRQ